METGSGCDHLQEEVTMQDVENYLKVLIGLIDDHKIRDFQDAAIPHEAEDFLGKKRAAFMEKSKYIVKMIREMYADPKGGGDKKVIHYNIQRLVASAKDPGRAMAVISRLWKYCLSSGAEMAPEDFQCLLEAYAHETGTLPLSYTEEFVLLPALEEWKKGGDVQQIMLRIEAKVQATFDAAHTDDLSEEEAVEYLKKGDKRPALRKKFEQTVQVREYLYKKLKPVQATKTNGTAK